MDVKTNLEPVLNVALHNMDIIVLLLFLICCFIFTYIERRYKIKNFIWLVIIPFCVIAATRSIDVPDTEIYSNYYLMEDSDLSYFSDFGFEFGYQLVTKLSKSVFQDNFSIYFGIISLLNSLLIFFAIKQFFKVFYTGNSDVTEYEDDKSNKIILNSATFYILYLAFYGFYVNFIVLRVGIAFSIILLAVSIALRENKKIKDYILIVLFAILSVLFHSTTLIGIIIILVILLAKQYSWKFYSIALFLIGVFYFVNITSRLGNAVFGYITSLNTLTLLSNKLGNYGGESLFMAEGISMKFVFYWMMAIILLFTKGNYSKQFYKVFNVFLLGLLLFALMRSILLIERVTDYFLLFPSCFSLCL